MSIPAVVNYFRQFKSKNNNKFPSNLVRNLMSLTFQKVCAVYFSTLDVSKCVTFTCLFIFNWNLVSMCKIINCT